MNRYLFVSILAVLLLLSACSSTKDLQKMSPLEAKQIADAYFAAQKYKKAIPYYQKIVNESSSILLAESQLKLADCFFYRHKYIDARFEYERFIQQFSDHEKVGDAFFQIGVCYLEESPAAHYDQTETYNAIDAFTDFLDRFPFHDKVFEAHKNLEKCRLKLLEKKYHNGYAYYKMSDYSSALLYFEDVIKLDKDNEFDKKAIYYSAQMYLKRGDLANSLKMLDMMLLKYPDDELTRKLQRKTTDKK